MKIGSDDAYVVVALIAMRRLPAVMIGVNLA